VIIHSSLPGMQAATSADMESFYSMEKQRAALQAMSSPNPPLAFLANPSANAVDLVWDAPRDGIVTGYEIRWGPVETGEWQSLQIGQVTRWHIDGLENGRAFKFRIRSARGGLYSAWSDQQTCTPGAVTDSSVLSMLRRIPFWTMTKIVLFGMWSVLRTRFIAQRNH
jgi:hypothetical protein